MRKKVSRRHHLKLLSQKPVCLVAGGAGFIGSYLCEELLSQDCQVVCIDSLLTGKKENIASCLADRDFTFIKHDLTKPLQDKLPKIDYVFHLAGVEAYLDKKDISLETLLVNASGTINLLELARKNEAKFLLASSIDVYSGAASTLNLKDYFGKKEFSKTLFSHHEAKRFAESLASEYFKKYKVDARIVRLGQVYGPRMNLEVGTGSAGLIKGILVDESLKVPGDGQDRTHLTFVSDVVDGILRAMFVSRTKGRIFSLADPKEATFLSFATEIQKQRSPSPSIEFVPKRGEEEFPLKQETLLIAQRFLSWKPKVDLREGIEKTLDYFLKGAGKKRLPVENKVETEKETKKKKPRLPKLHLSNKLSVSLTIFLLILAWLFYPFLALSFNSLWGVNRLRQAKKALVLAQFDRGAGYSNSAQKAFHRAKPRIDQLDWLLGIGGLNKAGVRAEALLEIGESLAEAAYHASVVAQAGTEVGAIVLQNQEGEIQELVSQIKTELDLTYKQLSLVEAALKSDPSILHVGKTFGLGEIGEELANKLPGMRQLILEIRDGAEILPELVALSGKRTYLVLLQNNMELRPTGGFIGSFALLTFENGRFIDFEVHNVYAADGQLKGHVEPPLEIKKYLGEAGWYLRDSNWDPDFPISAIKAEWFLGKEMGRSVDGVLAVNLNFAQKLLEAVGETSLPDYQEKITAENLFERAQYQAEVGFFPGSTQKEDFLGTLARALFGRVRNTSQTEWLGLGNAVYTSLEEKDLLVYLHEQKPAEVISRLGWDGSVKTVRCPLPTENCLTDYLMIVEANFGVNKANFFIKRELNHRVKIADDGTIEEDLQIVYQNQSSSENFPAGRYKNYLRIYTPEGTELQEIKIDGEALGPEKINIERTAEKAAFGFLVEVPIKEKRKIEVAYQLTKKLNLSAPEVSYLFLVQRQSGSSKDDLNFWLTYPSDITPVNIYPQAKPFVQTIFSKPKLNGDFLFAVDFAR